MKPKTKTLTATVKETIDFVYEYLSPHQNGIVMNAKSLGNVQRGVVTILVGRMIITKTAVPARGRRGVEWVYRWVATMPPTNVLYGSVTDEMRNRRREIKKRCKMSVKPTDKRPLPSADEPACEIAPMELRFVGVSDEDLWEELKRREYVIEGNAIVKTTRKVLS